MTNAIRQQIRKFHSQQIITIRLSPLVKKRPHGISQSISSPCNYRLRLQQPSQPNNRSQSSTTAHPSTHPSTHFPAREKLVFLHETKPKKNNKQNTALPANNNIIFFSIPWPTSGRIRQTPRRLFFPG